MKKLSLIVAIAMLTGMFSSSAFAEKVDTKGITATGITTHKWDFQDYAANATYTNDTNGIHYYAANAKYVIRGNNTNYLEIQQSNTGKYNDLRINLTKTDAAPLINSLADAKKYKVKFRMRLVPTVANKSLEMYLGGFWKFAVQNSGKSYTISCNNSAVTAVEGAKTNYNCSSTESGNSFHNYEIDVDKEKSTATFKVDGNVIFENVPQYNSNSFDSLYLKYSALTGNVAIDDVEVIVTDNSACSNADWENDTNVDFEDFTVGMIPASETENVGGFVNNAVEYTDSFFSFINYSYDSATPSTINKFLTVTKNSTDKAMSVKRDISSAVANYSEYEISFKIKNELATSSSTALIKDGDGSQDTGGTVVKFTKAGTASYFDYSTGAATEIAVDQETYPQAVITPGEWVNVKFRVNKDTNKSDIYIGDMETPVAEDVTSNYKYDGRTLVNSPQKSATGSVSIDDIVITPITEDDYVFTYIAGSADKGKYVAGTVTAKCKLSETATKTPLVLIGEFNESGELIKVAVSNEIDAQTKTVTAQLSGVTATDGNFIKLMLWDNETLYPIKRCVTLLPELVQ